MSKAPTLLLAAVAMAAFAGNSVLARVALASGSIDPGWFASLRVFAGALTLCLLAFVSGTNLGAVRKPDLRAAVALALYLVPFTYAYVDLGTGTGALILFACVQVTMLAAAVKRGERPSRRQWLGVVLAMAGVVYLLLPGVTAPSPWGASLMVVAGVAWAAYSLLGANAKEPVTATARNFVWATPFVLVPAFWKEAAWYAEASGIALAISSGAIASGVGYAIWYAVVRRVTATRAAALQLSVPALAAGYGALFLGEPVTGRLLVSAALILIGVGFVVAPAGQQS